MPILPNPPVIALLTDFGLSDWYVGTLKGVILTICPQAVLADVCHEVGKHQVEEAAFILKTCHQYFPDGTIFLCVVDPQVGSERRAIVARNPRHYFVSPDNGLLTFMGLQEANWEVREILNPAYMIPTTSHTFQGRDVFAPAAAHLAKGVPFEEFGPLVADFHQAPFIENVRIDKDLLSGRIIYIDHYGNLLSNITPDMLPDSINPKDVKLIFKGRSIHGIATHYSAVPTKHPLMYWGSSGVLEIGINMGSAAQKWNAQIGEWFDLEWT